MRPTAQCAFLIAALAARSFLPFTLGTTQSGLKVAVAEWFALIVRVQTPAPRQSPVQPAKLEVGDGVALNVTEVPCVYVCAQVEPQSIPAGVDCTEPDPAPALATVSV